MAVVERSVLVPFSAQQMYALVEDVESYPQFLPWCEGARVDAREPERTIATIEANFRGLRQQFTTQNRGRAGERLDIELVSGPFRKLHASWRFTALGEQGCRIDFRIEYQFSSRIVETVAGPVFHHIANTFVDAFVRRAESELGGK
jgi:ribosome-associated toxin RatA of RatAB toxin-antitoxin module